MRTALGRSSLGALALVCPAALGGCATTLGTLPFHAAGEEEITIDVPAATDLDLWSDFRASFTGDGALRYALDVVQDGVVVAHTTCAPIYVGLFRVLGIHLELTSLHVWDRPMDCSVHVPKGGRTIVRARF